MKHPKFQGHIIILAANLIFGLNAPIAKTLVPDWINPSAFTLLRMLFATIFFWGISLFVKQENKIPLKDLFIFFLGALFGMVCTQFSFAKALTYTSPVNISIIASMTPVVVMVLAAWILKEPVSIKKVIGVLLGACGALLIVFRMNSSGEGTNPILGDLYCIMNVVSYAIYLVLTRSVSQRYTALTLMKWMFFFSALLTLPFGIGDLMSARLFTPESVETGAIWRMAYVVVFATGIAYFLVPLALKRIRPTTVSMYNNVQPVITSIIAIMLGQDIFTWEQPVALVLVFWGVWLVTKSKALGDKEKA